jgi:hypothetical protein
MLVDVAGAAKIFDSDEIITNFDSSDVNKWIALPGC